MALFPDDVSQTLKDHIKASERRMMTAYFDPAGVPTAGYGHIKGVTSDMARKRTPFTNEQVDRWFEEDVDEAEAAVRSLVKVPLTQNEYDAIVDFTFNLGGGNLKKSTLLRVLNAGRKDLVPAELMRWTKAKNPNTGKLVELGGLVKRRKFEADLFQSKALTPPTPTYTKPAEPTTIPTAVGEPVTLFGVIAQLLGAIFGALFHVPRSK